MKRGFKMKISEPNRFLNFRFLYVAARKPSKWFAFSGFPMAATKELATDKQSSISLRCDWLSLSESLLKTCFRFAWCGSWFLRETVALALAHASIWLTFLTRSLIHKLYTCRITFLEASSSTFNFVISFFFRVCGECSAPPLNCVSFST